MPSREWRHRIEDILHAIEKIERYTREMDAQDFAADEKTIDAVIRNFSVIGEAARHVRPEVREKYPAVPWSEMQGMRNLVVHEYAEISARIAWDTLKNDLPPLVPKLRAILGAE